MLVTLRYMKDSSYSLVALAYWEDRQIGIQYEDTRDGGEEGDTEKEDLSKKALVS